MSGQGIQVGSQPSETTPVDMSTQIQVTIDGQQVTKSIQDLANGYAAGSKMTQATQRAAELEKELAPYRTFSERLNADPASVRDEIEARFGVAPNRPSTGDNLTDTDEDPVSAEVTELRQLVARQEQAMQALEGRVATQAQTSAIDKEKTELETLYGDAFKFDEVANYATSKKIGSLTNAFHAMRGEQMAAGSPSQKTLSPVLPGAAISPSAVTPPVKPSGNLLEALQNSYQSHGVDVEVSDLIPG